MTATIPDFQVTQREIVTTLIRYTRETGLELNASNFALYAHPDTVKRWIQTASGMVSEHLINLVIARREFLGFRLIEDPAIDPAHPVLRCTWEVAL